MDTALSPPVGQLLGGRYHVDSRIARGGMATVYLGTDTRLDRVIALKIAHPELSDDAEFVRRFIGEARSAARLSSPNVVAIFDQGSDKRLHYIAMEYVPGRTLRQLLNERGRLGAGEALDIMTGVLAGLDAAHEAGFAHRDVKPENVLLTPSGGVKVADFGLARSVAGAVQTKGGMIIGTAAYLAPEQVAGGTSDARTDVYAAGVMLFELLTGVQPHTGESPLAVAYKHVDEVVPPPSSVVSGISPAVDALVAMATSRDPDLRPGSAGQFLRAITEVRDSRAMPGTSPYAAPARYGEASGPHGGPGLHSGPLGRGLAGYAGSVPPTGPAHGSGPQPGLGGYQPAAVQSRPALSQPALSQPAQSQPAQSRPGQSAGSGQHRAAGRDSGSHPYQTAAGPFGPEEPDGRTSFLDAFDGEPDGYSAGYSSRAHGTSSHGAVGASALPSLSPQGAGLLPAPHADPPAMTNHTLVVSDAADLAPYGGPPGPPDRGYYPGRYGRRAPRGPREPFLQRYLFSGRLVYVLAALAAVLVVLVATWWFSSGRYQKVPALSGMKVRAAEIVLKNQGLKFRLAGPVYNPMAKGRVTKVTPARGRKVASGSTVTLTVSLGPHYRIVPDVSGQSEAAAKADLIQHHLTPGQDKPTVSTSVPAGYVIGTIPRAYSKIPQHRRVRLIISEGPGLPSFIGMQVTDAEAAAAAGGYHINAVADAKGSQPANTITSQSPSPNTPITAGEVVTVHYSPGPPTVPVPDVTGMPVSQAILVMHQAGFRITVNHQGPGGTVGSYSPTGNQPKNTVITLNIGIFSGL